MAINTTSLSSKFLLFAAVGITVGTTLLNAKSANAVSQLAPTIDETAFADGVVDYQRGTSDDWNSFFGEADADDKRWQVYDPNAALGVNNWTAEMTQSGSLGQWDNTIGTSLGKGGSLTVEFTDNALMGSGDNASDLWIFEIGGVAEKMSVEISIDGNTWYNAGVANREDKTHDYGVGFDIDPLLGLHEELSLESMFSFVRVTDTGDNKYNNFKAGADIDAIAALSSAPKDVPEPASIVSLLTLGAVGVGSTLKRKSLKK
jgi:hypothetical protein